MLTGVFICTSKTKSMRLTVGVINKAGEINILNLQLCITKRELVKCVFQHSGLGMAIIILSHSHTD